MFFYDYCITFGEQSGKLQPLQLYAKSTLLKFTSIAVMIYIYMQNIVFGSLFLYYQYCILSFALFCESMPLSTLYCYNNIINNRQLIKINYIKPVARQTYWFCLGVRGYQNTLLLQNGL